MTGVYVKLQGIFTFFTKFASDRKNGGNGLGIMRLNIAKGLEVAGWYDR